MSQYDSLKCLGKYTHSPTLPTGLYQVLKTRAEQETSRTVSGWDKQWGDATGRQKEQKALLHPRSSLTKSKGICHWGRVHNPHNAFLHLQSKGWEAKSLLTEEGGGWAEPTGENFKNLFKNKQNKASEQTKIGPNTCTLLTAGKNASATKGRAGNQTAQDPSLKQGY